MRFICCVCLLLISLLTACANDQSREPGPPGSDRDVHGCIPSAGYAWCARTNQCERPWELARKQGFENNAPAYDAYCKAPAH